MYEYLDGRVVSHGATRLVLDVAGVGYAFNVPLGAVFETAVDVRVWTHQAVKNDGQKVEGFALYGFPDRGTRDLFRLVLRVRGVGPSMALGLLSSLSVSELIEAVVREDTAALTRVKGVGKKTAQQLLLDLKDRIGQVAPELTAGVVEAGVLTPAPPPEADANLADAISALVSIGYPEKDARKNVERAAAEIGSTDLESLVRAALGR